jgi:cellulose synthase/poly-beta-1,6-N-acetylglucosamine synthase-like glycosyltransferase
VITAIWILYWLAAAGLFVYGVNCYVLVRSFRRHREPELRRLQTVRSDFAARIADADLPTVTIQIPVYNERFVVGRVIHAVARLDYPRDKFDIQVLDDSTDDTVEVIRRHVTHYRAAGLRIEHLRRGTRAGFKAGALRDGLALSRSELVAVFDADFVPGPDFLYRTIPFLEDPGVGLVQTRWGHVNEATSALTMAQSIAIDGHFGVEQAGRCWGGCFLNFNGTAGVWRRKAIDDAGGWHADTLTEDLDLSYRAQLAGYRIEYLLDVEVPAEVPADVSSFRSQQHRWAKGSIQTARKLLPSILRADLPWRTKVQAVIHLTHYLVHPLMLLIALLALPILLLWEGRVAPLPSALMAGILAVSACGPSALYLASQKALRKDWLRRIAWLPMLMLVGTGIAVSNTRAVIEALLGIRSGFVRTPKRALRPGAGRSPGHGYRVPLDLTFVFEAVLSLYTLSGAVLYFRTGKWLVGPFLLLYAAGFGMLAAASIREAVLRLRESRPGTESPAGEDPVAESETAYREILAQTRDPLTEGVRFEGIRG